MVLLVSYFTNLQIGLGVLTNHHTDLLVLLLKVYGHHSDSTHKTDLAIDTD